jgi:hypothetical protein
VVDAATLNVTRTLVPSDVLKSFFVGNTSLAHRELYRLNITALPVQGPAGPLQSEEFLVDVTPPVPGDVNDGAAAVSCTDAAGSCASDVDYSADVTAWAASWRGWEDPDSGIRNYAYGVSSLPCDSVYHRQCTERRRDVDGIAEGVQQPPPQRACSELEKATRTAAWAGTPGPGGNASRTAVPPPFNWATGFDLLPLQDVGMASGFNTTRVSLRHGLVAYGCLVVTNYAGLTTARSSDGLVIDVTPPVVRYIADGWKLPDVTTQSYTDALFANFVAEDYESNIDASEWAVTADKTPLDAAAAALEAHQHVDWDAVMQAVNASVLPFQSIGDAALAVKFDLSLNSSTYYAVISTVNQAGLRSRLYWSDGVLVGKNEVYPSNTSTSVVAFDMLQISNVSRNASVHQVTRGALSMAPGTLGAGQSLIAGVVHANEYGTGGVVDPRKTQAPANNMKFGGYEFTIKVAAPVGDGNGNRTVVDGYKFSQRVRACS